MHIGFIGQSSAGRIAWHGPIRGVEGRGLLPSGGHDGLARAAATLLRLLAFAVAAWLCVASLAWAQPVRPGVMILIEDKVSGVLGTTAFERPGEAETAMAQRLRELGFTVLDSGTLRRTIEQSRGLRLLEGDDAAAAAIALKQGAQFFVIGTAIAKPAGGKLLGSQLQSIHASLTARVVQSDTAQVVATNSTTAVVPHIDEVQGGVQAIRKAALQLADGLGKELLATEKRTAAGAPHAVTVLVTGLVSYRHMEFLHAYLARQVPGVTMVQMRTFAGGAAEFGVHFAGPTQNLAGHLAAQRFEGFDVEPTQVSANRIDARVVLHAPR